jgi:hypothetical protein
LPTNEAPDVPIFALNARNILFTICSLLDSAWHENWLTSVPTAQLAGKRDNQCKLRN